MKLSDAKKYLPFVQAAAEGKVIEMTNDNKNWWPTDIIYHESNASEQYRIKPTSTLRPWRPEEVPVGALAKRKDKFGNGICLIVHAKHGEVCCGQEITQTYTELFNNFEHSLDHGKTWLPCGVEE